jgi:hypothetical protein
MKRINVRELHHQTGALLDQGTKGHVMMVEKREGFPSSWLSSLTVKDVLPGRFGATNAFQSAPAC